MPLVFAACALLAVGIVVGYCSAPQHVNGGVTVRRGGGGDGGGGTCGNASASAQPPPPCVAAGAAPLFANHGKDVLSSWARPASAHVCSGGAPIEVFHGADHTAPQRFMPPEKRSCVFRNLCWSGSEFVYFRDAAHPLPFEHSNVAGAVLAPPSPLLAYGQKFATDDARDWLRLTVADGPIPASYSAAAGAGADGEPTVHVLVGASWLDNIGHELADSVWPAFGTLLETRMLALDNQVVIVGEPLQSFGSHAALSQRPPVSLASVPPQTCFPWAVAGNGGRGLPSPPLPSLFSWAAMQSFVFQRYGLPHGALGAAAPAGEAASDDDGLLRIVVRYKEGRHTFPNYDELVAGLRRCYPAAAVSLISPDKLSFEEELRVLARAAVYITPGGGGSFTAPFLSRNAVLVLGAACWPAAAAACQAPTPEGACCVQIERHVWSNWQYLHMEFLTYLGPTSAMVRDPADGLETLRWNYPASLPALVELINRGLFLSRGEEALAAAFSSSCIAP